MKSRLTDPSPEIAELVRQTRMARSAEERCLNRNNAVEFLGSAAAAAAVRRARAPNPGAPGRTQRWVDSTRYEWGAKARPTAPEAGALSIPTPSLRLNGVRRFDAARAMALASLPAGFLPEELKRQLFQRLYGQPLPS